MVCFPLGVPIIFHRLSIIIKKKKKINIIYSIRPMKNKILIQKTKLKGSTP